MYKVYCETITAEWENSKELSFLNILLSSYMQARKLGCYLYFQETKGV